MTAPSRVRLRGRLTPPGDKSVGHRLALLGAIANGVTRIEGFPPGRDCSSTLSLVESLGVRARRAGDMVEIEGVGLDGLTPAAGELDAGNSGTTARLACGLLAPQPFPSVLVGDESLSRRPFGRVIDPLTRMGARFDSNAGSLPITVLGGRQLAGIDYVLPVPSAQVKTSVLLAGLYATGTTRVQEAVPSRNHTEIALRGFGVDTGSESGSASVSRGSLFGGRFRVPGDFSSAAFFIVAAACLPGSELIVSGVGLNETRTALLDVLTAMGADLTIELDDAPSGRERTGTVVVRGGPLHGTSVSPEKLPAMIDEIPVLAVAAMQAHGETRVEGASELRVKESDRLSAILSGLRALGADVEELSDGFVVRGGASLRASRLESRGDHRMVMAWAVASLLVDGNCTIDHLDQVKISYPGFWETLDRLVL